MNKLLNIKLPFNHESNLSKPGPRNLNKTRKTKSDQLKFLLNSLNKVKEFYSKEDKIVKDVLSDNCTINNLAEKK